MTYVISGRHVGHEDHVVPMPVRCFGVGMGRMADPHLARAWRCSASYRSFIVVTAVPGGSLVLLPSLWMHSHHLAKGRGTAENVPGRPENGGPA